MFWVQLCVIYIRNYLSRRFVFFQAEDGIRYLVRSRGLGDVYKRQMESPFLFRSKGRQPAGSSACRELKPERMNSLTRSMHTTRTASARPDAIMAAARATAIVEEAHALLTLTPGSSNPSLAASHASGPETGMSSTAPGRPFRTRSKVSMHPFVVAATRRQPGGRGTNPSSNRSRSGYRRERSPRVSSPSIQEAFRAEYRPASNRRIGRTAVSPARSLRHVVSRSGPSPVIEAVAVISTSLKRALLSATDRGIPDRRGV